MFDDTTVDLAKQIIRVAVERGVTIATAESCTGGLVAGALTAVAGSSAVFDRGFVTYSNEAKHELLSVEKALIERVGAVSREVAETMARGAAAASSARLTVATTGVAGPGGGSADKPVGLVHFAVFLNDRVRHREERFGDIGRESVRAASVTVALRLLLEALASDP